MGDERSVVRNPGTKNCEQEMDRDFGVDSGGNGDVVDVAFEEHLEGGHHCVADEWAANVQVDTLFKHKEREIGKEWAEMQLRPYKRWSDWHASDVILVG